MEPEKFWEIVDKLLLEQGLTLTELAGLTGTSRNTIFGQRSRKQFPKQAQIMKMEEVLGVDLRERPMAEDFDEYLPYLRKAEPWQIKSVRQILGMPEESGLKKQDGGYIKEVN